MGNTPQGEMVVPQFHIGFHTFTGAADEEGDTILGADTDDLAIADDADHGKVWLYMRDPSIKDAKQKPAEYVIDAQGHAQDPTTYDPKKPSASAALRLIKGKHYDFWHSHVRLADLEAAAAAANKAADEEEAEAEALEEKATKLSKQAAEDEAEAKRLKGKALTGPKDTRAADKKAADEKAATAKKRASAAKGAKAEVEKAEQEAKAAKARAAQVGALADAHYESKEAGDVITLKSCAEMADKSITHPDGVLLHRNHDSYFYRGHLSDDVDGASNSYAPAKPDLETLHADWSFRMPFPVPGYADSFDDEGNLRDDWDPKTGYLKPRATKATKVWFAKDTGGKVLSTDPSIQAQKDPDGSFHLGRLDGILSAFFYPAKRTKKKKKGKDGKETETWVVRKPSWAGVQVDGEGRMQVRTSGEFKGYFVPRAATKIEPMRVPFISTPAYNKGTCKGITLAQGKAIINEIKRDLCLVTCVPLAPGKKVTSAFAIVADCGGKASGEGSPKLIHMLGMYPPEFTDVTLIKTMKDVRKGNGGIYRLGYLIFRGTRQPSSEDRTITAEQLQERGKKAFKAWGGVARLRCCFPELFAFHKKSTKRKKPAAEKKAKPEKTPAKAATPVPAKT